MRVAGPRSGLTLLELLVCTSVLSVIGAVWIGAQCACGMRSAEAHAIDALKQVVAAEATWRSCDLDRNGLQDYWTGDVAALYGAIGPDGQPMRLVDIDVARMDATTDARCQDVGQPSARLGYLMTPLACDFYGTSYRQDLDGDGLADECSTGFGFVAYPERRGDCLRPHARHTLSTEGQILIDERGLPQRLDPGNAQPAEKGPVKPPDFRGWNEG